ncbi:hypothetical protein [Gillisia sp. Hel_I_29]|nr:hypothetical protein [Gillisia sp. Hel_I_29]
MKEKRSKKEIGVQRHYITASHHAFFPKKYHKKDILKSVENFAD